MKSEPRRRAVVATSWVLVLVLTALLVRQRFSAATVEVGLDLESFFLPAARSVATGGSPYEASGYVYSPLVALILAPLAESTHVVAIWKGSMIAVAVVAVAVGVLACRGTLRGVRLAILGGVAVVSVLYSWPMAWGLWFGQPDAMVLLGLTGAMFAQASRRPLMSGLSLGLAAVVKTWPVGLLLWIVRAPLHFRTRAWLGAAIAGSIAVALALITAGLGGPLDMLAAALHASDQGLAAYSASGAGEFFFSDESHAVPILVSTALRVGLTTALALVVLALVVLLLRRPGDPRIALANLMFLVLLLLPVSHYTYLVLPVPALWWWLARVLESPRERSAWVPLLALGGWWLVVMRIVPAYSIDSAVVLQLKYAVVLSLTMAAVSVSVFAAARGVTPVGEAPRARSQPPRRRRGLPRLPGQVSGRSSRSPGGRPVRASGRAGNRRCA